MIFGGNVLSKDYQVAVPAHPNIYTGSARDLTVYFSEPDSGVNKETGLLLLICGYGATSSSNVYKKMRSKFSDDHNLVTVQCDYFGYEFCQQDHLKETLDNFNDMGIMQALDNLTALLVVNEIIKDNGLLFNVNRVMVYGYSHGAYLSYLCNAFAPGLFSCLIDNSAWIYPMHLLFDRTLGHRSFEYLAKTLITDTEILLLPVLYERVSNQCIIHCFHGSRDHLINIKDKMSFCSELDLCSFHEINDSDVDGRIFKSSEHGLGADFLLLFDYVMSTFRVDWGYRDQIMIDNHEIQTSLNKYRFDYSQGLPVLYISCAQGD